MKTTSITPWIRLHRWWRNNWQKQVWIVGIPMLVLAGVMWWAIGAASFGTTIGKDRDAEIRALIGSEKAWKEASIQTARISKIIKTGTSAIQDPVGTLIAAEQELEKATKAFDKAGFDALAGEVIIISGILLQVLTTLLCVALGSIEVQKWRRQWENRSYYKRPGGKEGWVNQIRTGQIIPDEDDILKFVRGESDENLPKGEKERGEGVVAEYKDLLLKWSRATQEEPPWKQFSKLFYKLAEICKERCKPEYETELRSRYEALRDIIGRDTFERAVSSIAPPLIFIGAFWLISTVWDGLAGPILGQCLGFWRFPITLFAIALIANGAIHIIFGWLAQWFTEKTWTDLDDVMVGVVIGPLSAVITAVLLLGALDILTGPTTEPLEFGPFLVWLGYEAVVDPSRTLIVVTVGTWFAVFILNRVIIWLMERWAKRTEQKYDDMFVKVVQVFGTFIILAIGIGAALAVFNSPISETTGIDSVLLPYSIVISVFTAILGYASRAGFENFFGGLLLQIEKPFDRGERIVLPDGKICDIREIGMRSTVLYNVLENSEVSVPNSEMSRMTITNVSRPDLELRIPITIWISPEGRKLKDAEAILLDIAYLEEEIDEMRVSEKELPNEPAARLRGRYRRSTISEEFGRLYGSHKRIEKTTIYRIIGGGNCQKDKVFGLLTEPRRLDDGTKITLKYQEVLYEITELRERFNKVLQEENDELSRIVAGRSLGDPIVRTIRRALREAVFNDQGYGSDGYNNLLREIELREAWEENTLSGIMKSIASKEETSNKNPKDWLRGFFEPYELKRRGIVLQISDRLGTLSNYVFAIAEQNPEVRQELDLLISEINKEPVVFSEFTEDGHAKVTLNCYALYLERRFEVEHKINRDIERRFKQAGIEFVQPRQLQ
jgi:small-conductance mechanosensitive channel